MCQTGIIDCGNKNLNSLFLYLLSSEDSRVSHKDGFGFVSAAGQVWKTEMAASDIVNLGGEIFKANPLGTRVMFHCRLASFDHKIITAEKAHPFESKDLILTHNGTLTYTGLDGLPADNIDSENFLNILQKKYTRYKNVPQAVKEAYTVFTGKFAFIILEKSTGNYYVVKGRTADLHKIDFTIKYPKGSYKGIVINTEKDSLLEAMVKFKNIAELVTNCIIEYTLNAADIIPCEKIFLLDDKNNLVQQDLIYEKVTARTTGWVGNWGDGWDRDDTGYPNRIRKEISISKKITNVCAMFEFSLIDLDRLIYETIEKPMISCTQDDLADFYNMTMIPLLAGEKSLITNHKKKVWEKIIKNYNFNYDEIYTAIQFPWIFNSAKELEKFNSKAPVFERGV